MRYFRLIKNGGPMFIFFLVIAILVLIALIVFMLIELNMVEQAGLHFLSQMRKRYGEEE